MNTITVLKKRDGTPRKGAGHVVIKWDGKDTEKNRSGNFAHKWRKYADAWDLLERPRPS